MDRSEPPKQPCGPFIFRDLEIAVEWEGGTRITPPICGPKDFDGNIIFGKFVDAEKRIGKSGILLAGWLAGYNC